MFLSISHRTLTWIQDLSRVCVVYLHAYTHRTAVYSFLGRTFLGQKVCTEFWLRGNCLQSARKAWHEAVTHPCGDHAQSRLTMAIESECSRCVLLVGSKYSFLCFSRCQGSCLSNCCLPRSFNFIVSHLSSNLTTT